MGNLYVLDRGKKRMITKKIRVYGIVQGVGFRPTVSRHAAAAESPEVCVTKVPMWKSLHRERKNV